MELEQFLVINSGGEMRKLLKIKDRPKKNFSQITAYLGDGFGLDRRLGAYKYSIHPPRLGNDENLIHFKAVKKNSEEEWFEHRHYTRALTKHNSFAHVFSGRYQTLAPLHNAVVEGKNIIQIPEEFDPKTTTLTVGVYIGNKGTLFDIPAGEYVKIIRIEASQLSYIVLYILEKRCPTIRFSQNIVTVTLPQDKVENPAERPIHDRIMQGCTPEFSVNQFVIHHFDLLRDYWRVWIQEAEARQVPQKEMQEFRIFVAERLMSIEVAEMKRIRDGKQGRYLRAQLD